MPAAPAGVAPCKSCAYVFVRGGVEGVVEMQTGPVEYLSGSGGGRLVTRCVLEFTDTAVVACC